MPGSLGGATQNNDFPRSHVVLGILGGAATTDDFPRSHVLPGILGGASGTTWLLGKFSF